MEKFIMASGAALRIDDSGKGDVCLVLIHGYLETLDIWEETVKELSKRYRVISMDLPGHGVSQTIAEVHTMEFLADTVADILKQQGIEKAFVAGHSMGGYVALAFAKNHSDMLRGLILVHSTPNPDSPEKKDMREREITMIREGKKELLATLVAPKGFGESNRKRLHAKIEEFEELIPLNDDDGIIAILRGMKQREDMKPMMRSLKIPQLMIFGRLDEYIAIQTAETVIAEEPQAKVVWFENSGHNSFLEEPDAFCQTILEFIEANI